MKRVFLNLQISKVFYVLILIANIVVDVRGGFPNRNIIQYFVIMVLGYGLLCQHGFFKKEIKREGTVIEYEQSVPTLAWGVSRLVQWVFYYMLRAEDVIMGRFWFLVILEVLYIAFLLYDKSKYYYESREIPDGVKKS